MERVICLRDKFGDEYVLTDAPTKYIKEGIDHYQELLSKGEDYGDSEFSIIQRYLEDEGYEFELYDDMETIYW